MRPKPVWALAAIAAAIAIPSLAWGDPPPLTASIYAYDLGSEDARGSGDSTVTIAPGGTVEFSYPTGANFHDVDFDDPTAPPTSCTQTVGMDVGDVPPLPAVPLGPGWAGSCRFDTPGIYAFHCDAHRDEVRGTVVVTDDASPTPTTSATPTASATQTTTATATASATPGATPSDTPGATASSTPTASATATSTPTAIPTATATPNATPAATATPSPTPDTPSGAGTPTRPPATAAQGELCG